MISKAFKWFISSFSEKNGKASSKRLTGFLAANLFCLIVLESIFATHRFPNIELIMQITEYLFYIILIALLGVSAVDIFSRGIKNPFTKNEENNQDNTGQ